MNQHPIDLECRAVKAFRRRVIGGGCDGASCHEISGRIVIVVRHLGAAVSVYHLRGDGRLQRAITWSEDIW